jgi:hypothetical protein
MAVSVSMPADAHTCGGISTATPPLSAGEVDEPGHSEETLREKLGDESSPTAHAQDLREEAV